MRRMETGHRSSALHVAAASRNAPAVALLLYYKVSAQEYECPLLCCALEGNEKLILSHGTVPVDIESFCAQKELPDKN